MLDPAHDPHAAIIFPSLPAGNLVERNPLPYHEPPYVPKPFLGRSIELQRLVLMLGRKRNKEVRMVAPTLALALALALTLTLTLTPTLPLTLTLTRTSGRSSEDRSSRWSARRRTLAMGAGASWDSIR